MDSLFEIASEYKQAFEELAETDLPPEAIADTLEGLSGSFDKKGLAVGHYIANLEAEASMVDDAVKRFTARRNVLRNRASRYRDYLLNMMLSVEKDRLNSPTMNIHVNKPRMRVSILDTDSIPDDYVRMERKVSLSEIKKALEAGELVEGAKLELGQPSIMLK